MDEKNAAVCNSLRLNIWMVNKMNLSLGCVKGLMANGTHYVYVCLWHILFTNFVSTFSARFVIFSQTSYLRLRYFIRLQSIFHSFDSSQFCHNHKKSNYFLFNLIRFCCITNAGFDGIQKPYGSTNFKDRLLNSTPKVTPEQEKGRLVSNSTERFSFSNQHAFNFLLISELP